MNREMSNFREKLKEYFVTRETSKLDVLELLTIFGIVISIFFPIRYVLKSHFSNILGYYSDFTAISIYLSFILLIANITIVFYRLLKEKNHNPLPFLLKLLAVFLIGLLLYQVNIDPSFRTISVYFYLRITCVLLFGYCVYKSPIWLKYEELLLWIVIPVSVIQVLISVTQFCVQHSLGLNFLGESPLSIDLYGVAKIVSHGTTYIRGYGTLPHPNILAAFLVITSLLNIHLLNNSKQLITKVILSFSYFFVIFGLFITFSRAGVLSFLASTLLWFAIQIYRSRSLKIIQKLWIVPVSTILIVLLLFPWIQSRGTLNDQATAERSIYNQVGLSIIQNNWVIGTGPGTNLFHMEQKLKYQLDEWNIQPIHNIWLLIISEWGIIGLFACLFALSCYIRLIITNLSRDIVDLSNQIYHVETLMLSIFTAILILFWFDHYFYTIWSAQIVLAIITGITYRLIESKRK